MANIYKISPGDTLSRIAARQKTDVANLLKLNPKIKDPNRIYAGDVLNLPEAPAAPAAAPGKEFLAETAATVSPRELLTQKITEAVSAPAPKSLARQYSELRAERGIPKLEETVSSYESEVTKTLGMLDELEKNIGRRVAEGGYIVSEAQRQRLLASEKKPLADVLSTLQRGETEAEAKLARAEKGIETELGFAKEEKAPLESAKTLADLLKALEPEKTPTATRTVGGRVILYNTQTGEEIKDLGPATSGAAPLRLSVNTALELGLPLTLAGKTQEEVFASIEEDDPADWFVALEEKRRGAAMTAEEAKAAWSAFKAEFGKAVAAQKGKVRPGLNLSTEDLQKAITESLGGE
jgi:LysM repeat protein